MILRLRRVEFKLLEKKWPYRFLKVQAANFHASIRRHIRHCGRCVIELTSEGI